MRNELLQKHPPSRRPWDFRGMCVCRQTARWKSIWWRRFWCSNLRYRYWHYRWMPTSILRLSYPWLWFGVAITMEPPFRASGMLHMRLPLVQYWRISSVKWDGMKEVLDSAKRKMAWRLRPDCMILQSQSWQAPRCTRGIWWVIRVVTTISPEIWLRVLYCYLAKGHCVP